MEINHIVAPQAPAALTADQRHCFTTSPRWREFRTMFSSTEEALAAYAKASQEAEPKGTYTHELRWRFIFHNRASIEHQFVGLLLAPLGHMVTCHAEFRFKTLHCLTPVEARRLRLGRFSGSCLYHLCFIALIAAAVGVMITVLLQLMNGFALKLTVATITLALTFAFIGVLSQKTRSIGLSGTPRLIAKDAFDLTSIRRIRR